MQRAESEQGTSPRKLNPEEQALVARPLDELADADLRRRAFVSLRMAKLARSPLARWRAGRDSRRALSVLRERVVARMGCGGGACERCGSAPPTVHVAYGHDDAERFGHFCEPCSRLEPPGWLAVAQVGGRDAGGRAAMGTQAS